MIIDTLRPTTNYGAWDVTVEFTDMEDNSPIDFSAYPNIVLEVFDAFSDSLMMTLSRTNGVTTPAPGIIEWHASRGQMNGLRPGTYRVRMAAWQTDQDDAIPLIDSSISVVGDRNV